MTVTVRLATPEELDACIDVRRDVFVEGQNVPEDIEVDGLDPDCTHFIAFIDGRAMGTARLRVAPEGYAKAERVAVRAEARGQRLGHRLMEALEAEARNRGHEQVVLSAQVTVIPFYEARGYVAEGPVYLDADIEHRTMRLRWPKP